MRTFQFRCKRLLCLSTIDPNSRPHFPTESVTKHDACAPKLSGTTFLYTAASVSCGCSSLCLPANYRVSFSHTAATIASQRLRLFLIHSVATCQTMHLYCHCRASVHPASSRPLPSAPHHRLTRRLHNTPSSQFITFETY